VILRPGSLVTDAELWPSAEFPRIPLLLEAALVPRDQAAARRRLEPLYVLWRYDQQRNAWSEIGRAKSESWHWALELRGLAVRAMADSRALIRVRINLTKVQQRIAAALDRELKSLDFAETRSVLGILHDQLAWRAAAIGSLAPGNTAVISSAFPGNGDGSG
jgi:hypothetical protein